MDKYVGKRLDGRYEIQEIIGVGGMAVVYKAHDNVENRTVAIKILKDEFVTNEEFIRRFKNESKAIAMLSHPNIVKVYDVSFGDIIQYIVMEYIDGITLKEFIERQGSLRWKDAVYFTIQILKALQHAHDKGIVHRDVKPQNIMVLSDGSIKVADFGIARFARNEQRTVTDKAIGSVHYISPEQARGEKTNEKTDIYSVGVILYEMLTGSLPFDAESAVSVAIMQLQRDPKLPTEINPAIPLGLEQITMHAMQKTQERRYQSASELLCDLEQFKKDPATTFEYSYFVDNSPTKFVDTIMSATPASAVTAESEEVVEETHEKSNMIPILAGIASALVVAIIVVVVWVIIPWLNNRGDTIVCPDFISEPMTLEDAKEEYPDLFKNILVEIKAHEEYDPNLPEDTIIAQSTPADGKLVMSDKTKLILYVNRPTNRIEVPNVYEKTEAWAVTELEARGFVVQIKKVEDENIPEGYVIKTEPARTTVCTEGDKIIVYVSEGQTLKEVTIPKIIVGMKEAAAKEQLAKINLSADVEYRDLKENEDMPAGFVLEVIPGAGEKVAEGTTVTIVVSTGEVEVVNYKYSTKFSITDSFKTYLTDILQDSEETAVFSLWHNGVRKDTTETFLLKDVKTIDFGEKETTEPEITYIIRIQFASDYDDKAYDYAEVTIDTKTNKITDFKEIKDGADSYTTYTKYVEDNESTNQGPSIYW